jgi:Membrane protein involved in the export of O-antigen and teichoic acid
MSRFSPKNIFRTELIRNSSILLSGTALGQLIAFLAYPALTRLYSNAEFGILASFLSVCGILTALSTGRYEESFVIAKDKKETTSLVGLSLKLLFAFSLLFFIILLFFRKESLALFKWDALEPFWVYIPLTIFFTGLFNLFNNLATREKQFKRMTSSSLTQNLVSTAAKLVFGFLSFTGIGQILSNLLSYLGGNLPFYSLRGYIKDALKGRWKDEKQVAIKYKDFPTYNLGRLFVSNISLNLPFLLLLSYFDDGQAKLGLYSLSFILLYRPIQLIANVLYLTFFENSTSSTRNNKSILPQLQKYWISLCKFILPCFILAGIVARPVFQFIFGSDWNESGLYFQYLLPWMFMMTMVSPVYFIPILFNQQNKALIIEIIFLILRLSSLYVGIRLGDFQLSILLFSISGFIFSSVLFIWFYSLVKKHEKVKM